MFVKHALLLSAIRHRRSLHSISTLSYVHLSALDKTNNGPKPSFPSLPPILSSYFPNTTTYSISKPFPFSLSRSLSTSSNHDDSDEMLYDPSALSSNELEASHVGPDTVDDSLGVFTGIGVGGSEDLILPIHAVMSLLDRYHEFSGFPWWIVIASSTLAMRVSLLPLLVLQLRKLKRVSELFPKLPTPFRPPLSGRSLIDQLLLFRKERRAIGCPSFLWLFAYVSVQIPCFLLWMASIRRMSLDQHPGFDSGGTLWFQNLTECPHGVLSPIFPLLIAGLHYLNIQLSFRKTSFTKSDSIFGLLAKYYKHYLDFLTLPIFVIGFYLPQGSLLYWVTNSSLSVLQLLLFNHPGFRGTLGLPDQGSPSAAAEAAAANPEEIDAPRTTFLDSSTKMRRVSVENLSPKELLILSVQLLSKGQQSRAIPLLQLALEKDPNYVRALTVLGQTLLQQGKVAEAAEYLESAISRLFLTGNQSDAEYIDLLMLASQWAGVACIRQGKNAEGIVHLERVASLKEPEDPKNDFE
ncbi:hypothetical protein K2173_028322 [Erythroxylum novogranatense]|uniref:ALBINO3-like protein 2, chloroplastic n=1 Tax=Erythroxylum novogranatense TaxID=1862640 RepID=A0AAV8U591_9ROSI|nr:hypothetical protein K2173_028322 [Erythroxylum novogranatense]